jgi:hypothetical protein
MTGKQFMIYKRLIFVKKSSGFDFVLLCEIK